PGLSAQPYGDAGGGTGTYRRWSLLCRTTRGEARIRAYLRGLGAEPGFLSGWAASRVRSAAEPRCAGPRDVPAHGLGGAVRCAPRRECLCAIAHVGCGGYQRQFTV